ncbi:MAG: NAD(P)-dependent oxidoreductase [Thermoleophilia bacterium]
MVSSTLLILGGTGYLGSRLAAACVAEGHRVAVLKRRSSDAARLSGLDGVELFDLEETGVESSLAAVNPDMVVHAAGVYGRSGETCAELLEGNTALPLRLLDAAAAAGVPTFVSAGTALSETLNGYALSKHQFSQWGKLVATDWPLRFLDVRVEHFYGPGDDDVKFATHAARAFLAGEATYPLTPGEQERDFVYIDDVVSGFLTILRNARGLPLGYREFGVGSGEPVTIRRFVEVLREQADSPTVPLFGALSYRRHEVMHSCADTSALRSLGWAPKVSLPDGIRRTLDGERERRRERRA